MFSELARIGPAYPTEEEDVLHRFPFRTYDSANEPHPGLRSYPFLSQAAPGPIYLASLWRSKECSSLADVKFVHQKLMLNESFPRQSHGLYAAVEVVCHWPSHIQVVARAGQPSASLDSYRKAREAWATQIWTVNQCSNAHASGVGGMKSHPIPDQHIQGIRVQHLLSHHYQRWQLDTVHSWTKALAVSNSLRTAPSANGLASLLNAVATLPDLVSARYS